MTYPHDQIARFAESGWFSLRLSLLLLLILAAGQVQAESTSLDGDQLIGLWTQHAFTAGGETTLVPVEQPPAMSYEYRADGVVKQIERGAAIEGTWAWEEGSSSIFTTRFSHPWGEMERRWEIQSIANGEMTLREKLEPGAEEWERIIIYRAAVEPCKVHASAMQKSPSSSVTLITSEGEIVVDLFTTQAPETVANFLAYADMGFYDNTIFHSALEGQSVSAGGYTSSIVEKSHCGSLPNEYSSELPNKRGMVAMAWRESPEAAAVQFLINVSDNPALDSKPGHAVFGQVSSGMEIVESIANTRTMGLAGLENVPMDEVLIEAVRRNQP